MTISQKIVNQQALADLAKVMRQHNIVLGTEDGSELIICPNQEVLNFEGDVDADCIEMVLEHQKDLLERQKDLKAYRECPLCGATSGDDWSQCPKDESCPMRGW